LFVNNTLMTGNDYYNFTEKGNYVTIIVISIVNLLVTHCVTELRYTIGHECFMIQSYS